jgi:ubiquinone/menaquinone biosynthesis C-methylase UbiE
MGYKEENISVYDQFAQRFDPYFQKSFDLNVKTRAEEFAELLPNGAKLLDLGSGPGNHALFFQNRGFEVACLDLSEKMLEICREKGLKTIQMDIESLSLTDNSYDAIWAFASLLHIPRETAPQVIRNLHLILRPNGLLALAVKEGVGEQYETHEKFGGSRRWFVYYTAEDLMKLVEHYFEVIYLTKDNVQDKYHFLNFFLRKKSL